MVDAAWDIPGVLARLDEDGMELTGALVTHYHPDHVGGDAYGLHIGGLAELMAARPVKVYAHKQEIDGIELVTGLSRSDFAPVESGDTLAVGDAVVRFVHTPGHTPGSQCFLVNDQKLAAGDAALLHRRLRADQISPAATPSRCTRASRSAWGGCRTTSSCSRATTTGACAATRWEHSARPAMHLRAHSLRDRLRDARSIKDRDHGGRW